MSLLRFTARSMFAGFFIVDGAAAVKDPAPRADQVGAFADKVVPLVQRAVPASYSSRVPEDAASWVRISGVAKVLGGLMYATGIGRRLGACLLAGASICDIAIACPEKDASPEEKRDGRMNALKHVALLGAALIASRDTQGLPSLAWRAEQRAKLNQQQSSVAAKKAKEVKR